MKVKGERLKVRPLPRFMAFAPPLTGAGEIAEVAATLKSGWLTTGPRTERFEKELAEYLGSGTGLAVSSCTAALHLGLEVLEVGPGQGVVTTPLTFASTAHVILYQRARPFLADIDPATGNLDPAEVRRFLTRDCVRGRGGRRKHKKTGETITTLMPVHYGGHPADMASFRDLAEEFKLNILEDAAHALGALHRGRPVGGREPGPRRAGPAGLAAFSFYATKNITTGEGGFLTAASDDLVERARMLSMYGISDSRRIWGRYAPKGTWVYDVAALGFKYNMMDIQAALGLRQLRKLPEFLRRRAAHARTYQETLAGLQDLVELPQIRPEVTPAWHLYPLRLRPGALALSRDEFIEKLRACGLGTSVLFIPLHYHSFYQKALGCGPGSFPRAEAFFQGLVNLPVAPAHRPAAVARAARLLAALLTENARPRRIQRS